MIYSRPGALHTMDFRALQPEYAATWRAMAINDDQRKAFEKVAARLYSALPLYQAVERTTGVPAAVIAVIHERESGGRFDRHLHNGDPLTERTYHVPAGRPVIGDPPFSWAESARDALIYENLAGIKDWTVERALFSWETYNGFGYRLGPRAGGVKYPPMRSPYLWGGTNQQQPGKYVADGVFDPNVMDVQLGCAGLFTMLCAIDPALRLPLAGEPGPQPDEHPVPLPPVRPPLPPMPRPRPPTPPAPVQQGLVAALVAVLLGAFIAFREQAIAFLHALFN